VKAISKEQLLECEGMNQSQAAAKLKVPRSTIIYYVRTYGMAGFFKRKAKSPQIARSVYEENIGANIHALAKKLKVDIATVRNHLNFYEMAHLFGVEGRSIRKRITPADTNIYHRPIKYTCMNADCNATFDKDISTDLSDKQAARLKFMCSGCRARSGSETTYSYSGQ
jgi:transposase